MPFWISFIWASDQIEQNSYHNFDVDLILKNVKFQTYRKENSRLQITKGANVMESNLSYRFFYIALSHPDIHVYLEPTRSSHTISVR